ncbi:unnamed protein product [Diatraea saccharalis]|uniref:Lysozyme n=1 Tax=Diatraea saccharalis TaxID=40085 RepID=A0A9N9QTE4_9NEOP|nr:unnamed protein product [Diatraea saccharalis]
MFHAASWTFTLLVLTSARVYERCELARELLTLGIERDHISTWVCIAYHESRLDTASQNYQSGDHGIFQISELYWCGPGKVCGLSCSDLRDEDIADDVQCALQVHEEHTRLQGDGFLAWVVYSQNCKHNTKKYIIDCDQQMKNVEVKTTSRSRKINLYNATAFVHNPNIDNLKPPYLAINSILRGQFNKVFQEANRKIVRNNWLNYKVDNIDDLNLPIFNLNKNNQEKHVVTTPSHITSADNSTTSEKPWNRKYIETKQFRKRIFHDDKPKPIGNIYNEISKSSPSYINDITSISSRAGLSDIVSTTTIMPVIVTATRTSPLITTSEPSRTIATTNKPTTLTTKQEPSTTVSPIFNMKPTVTSRPLIHYGFSRSIISSPVTRTTIQKLKTDTTTTKPTNVFKPSLLTSLNLTTFKKLASNTTLQNKEKDRDSRSFNNFKFTTKSLTSVTTKKPVTSRNVTEHAHHRKGTTQHPLSTKATQSIFDLYLNPTKSPQLRTYKFPQFNNSAFKLKIFSDGTTTPGPKFNKATSGVSSNARNYVRRQT